MKKVLFVSNVLSHIEAFHLPYLEWFKKCGYEVHVMTNAQGKTADFCDKLFDIGIERSPFNIKNLFALKQAKKIVNSEEYDIIHSHTPLGGVIGRLAATKARKRGTKVLYTAHGFHFYKGAPLKNWLLYYPLEKFLSRWTDVLITINKEDYRIAKNKMHAKETFYVPGVGIDAEIFANTVIDRNNKRERIGIPVDAFLLLSVGELNKNKNHEVVIRAISQLKNENIHFAIAGQGDLKNHLYKLANDLGVSDKIHFLGYRTDIAELYKAADVYIHPSFREGLSVALMEAMASGLPCVVSKIRGNIDLINDKGGFLCQPNDYKQFSDAIIKIQNNIELHKSMGEYNSKKARNYDLSNIRDLLIKAYQEKK